MLNPARVRLAEAIAALDRARAEVELAAEPVRRLSDVIAEYDRLEAQVWWGRAPRTDSLSGASASGPTWRPINR
jgi:hypothetical protein